MPIYNRRFSVKPKKGDNLHRKVPKGIRLDSILCIKTERVLKNDFTISHNGRLYQILDKTTARKVQVEESIKGTMAITHEGNRLRFKEITERPERVQKKPIIFVIRKKTGYIPPVNPVRRPSPF